VADVHRFAAAAVEDCTAALGCCQPDLKHKVGLSGLYSAATSPDHSTAHHHDTLI
jgi:hypothetical protein